MGSTISFPWSTKDQNDEKTFPRIQIQDLTKEEAKIAEEAKQMTLEILQDALEKKDKVLMKVPNTVFLKGEEKEPFWMERHAILTEDIVEKLIAALKMVTFKKDIGRPCTYAYVIQTHKQKIIYLCDLFWKAPKHIEKDSQPGILIHELSHFLGTRDITYEESTVYVGCKGSLVKGSSENSSCPLKKDYWEGALRKAFLNANSIAHEFELTLNHRGSYVGGKYSCCGETKRYSVCESSVPDYFHTCTFDKTWETEILLKELHRRSEAIACNLKKSHKTIKDIHEYLRKSHLTKPAGGATGMLTRHLLASLAFGLSAPSAEVLMAFLMGGMTVSEIISKIKLYSILDEYLRFFDIQSLLKFLDGTEIFADAQQEYVFLVNILCISIDLL